MAGGVQFMNSSAAPQQLSEEVLFLRGLRLLRASPDPVLQATDAVQLSLVIWSRSSTVKNRSLALYLSFVGIPRVSRYLGVRSREVVGPQRPSGKKTAPR